MSVIGKMLWGSSTGLLMLGGFLVATIVSLRWIRSTNSNLRAVPTCILLGWLFLFLGANLSLRVLGALALILWFLSIILTVLEFRKNKSRPILVFLAAIVIGTSFLILRQDWNYWARNERVGVEPAGPIHIGQEPAGIAP